MKRVVFFVAALFFCTSSVFAWNAESFTNGSAYEYEPVMAASTFSLDDGDDGVAVVAESDSFVNKLTWDDMRSGLSVPSLGQFLFTCYNNLINYPLVLDYPSNGFSLSKQLGSWSGLDWVIASGSVVVPTKISSAEVDSVYGCYAYDGSDFTAFYFDLDISSLGDFYSFSLSGSLNAPYEYKNSGSSLYVGNCSLALYVNGVVVKDWPGILPVYEMSDFIYSSSVPITSISFRLNCNNASVSVDPGTSLECFVLLGSSNLSLSVLRDDAVLDGFNDQAQDSINEHESVESQWTGSMTENFNALDMDSFTFPDGLVSAFALITGIFQDIWNGMGEYKILYVFPLTLAIALLLVGRISKFAGTSGSGKNKGGDDGA